MALTLKTSHLNGLFLKCCSLIIGYTLWSIMSQPYAVQTTIMAPISFYNTHEAVTVQPESVKITVHGTRKELYKTALRVAVHCDGSVLQPGENKITVTPEQILLPETVTLLHYSPTHFTVVQKTA